MIKLTEEQRRELQVASGTPPRVVDPGTQQEYVLVRAEIYDRLHMLLDDSEVPPRDAYPLVDRVMAEDDAGDPTLHDYQRYQRDS